MVHPVGMSKVWSLFVRTNICNSVKLSWIVTKVATRICLFTFYKCTKFQPIKNTCLRVRADFVICVKRRRRKKNPENLLTCISEAAGVIYFNFGMLPPLIARHFHSKFGDLQINNDRSMNAWKLLLCCSCYYTHSHLHVPRTSWAAWHTTVCLDHVLYYN